MSTFAKVIVGALLLACVLVGLRIAVARMGLLPQLTPEQLSAIELMSQRLASDKPDGYSALHLLFFDVPDEERQRLERLDAVSLATEIQRRNIPRIEEPIESIPLCAPISLHRSPYKEFSSCLTQLKAQEDYLDHPPDELYAQAARQLGMLEPIYRYSRFDSWRFTSQDAIKVIAATHPAPLDIRHEDASYPKLPNGSFDLDHPEIHGYWYSTDGEAHDELDDQLLGALGGWARTRAGALFNNGKPKEAMDMACRDARYWREVFADATSFALRQRANQELATDGLLIVDMNLRSPSDAVVDEACLESFRPRSSTEDDPCESSRSEYRITLRDHEARALRGAPRFSLDRYIEWNPRHAAALAATYFAPACSADDRQPVAHPSDRMHGIFCTEDERYWDSSECSYWEAAFDAILSVSVDNMRHHTERSFLPIFYAALQINARPDGKSIQESFWALPVTLRSLGADERTYLALFPSESNPESLALMVRGSNPADAPYPLMRLPLRRDP